MGLRQDLVNFIGCRIVAAMREIKPKLLDDVCSKDEEACAEQEAVYLQGVADGITFASFLSAEKRGDGQCFKASDSPPEE